MPLLDELVQPPKEIPHNKGGWLASEFSVRRACKFRRLAGGIAVAPLPKAGAISPRWDLQDSRGPGGEDESYAEGAAGQRYSQTIAGTGAG